MSNYNTYQFKNQDFSQEAINDLQKSGLDIEIIQEAKITPAIKLELERYKINWFDKNRREERFKPLYVIPYLKTESDEGKFCRVKVIPTKPELFDGKYTQPPSQVLRDSCHLYILPSEFEKLKSQRCKFALVEGEKKTLKLIQELRKIEKELLDYKVAVIGISGINNWQTAPEWKLLNLAGREAILFFDADSEYNKRVVEAELELAGFLYSKGAVVESAVWSVGEGKGIDDFLVNAGNKQLDKLKGLLDSAISVFEKYKNRMQDKELLRAFFKYPIRSDRTRLEYLTEIVRQETNVKIKTINNIIKIMKIELEEELQEKLQEQIKEIFGNSNINIPSGFLWEEGFLKTDKGQIITKFFIVKERILDEKAEQTGLILKFVDGKEIFINTEDLNKKSLTLLFNKNNTGMDEKTAVKVLEYITQYQNVNFVPERKKAFSIGWIGDDYYLPQVVKNIEFDEDLTEQYKVSGSKEKELELMRLIFEKGRHLALGYILGFSSTLIKVLDLQNFVVFFQGFTGKGKTTANLLGLSLFGNYKKIKRNLNTTETGLEIYLANRKDTLILLDEVNTGKRDVVNQLVKIIYDYEGGKGRTRATTNLRIRQTAEYRGILSISSEDSLKHLLEQTEKEAKGALRRTIIVDFGEFEDVDKDLFTQIYQSIGKHYGNLIKDWIEFVKNNEDIEVLYYRWVDDLRNEDRGFRFNGQERHLALLFATAELVNKVFNVDTEDIFNILWNVADYNHFEFVEAVEITRDRLKDKLEQFISENIQNFYHYELTDQGVLIEKVIPKKLFGKIEQDETDENITHIFLTSLGLKEFAKNSLGLPEKEVKKLLVDFGFASCAGDRIIKQTTKRIAGASIKVYPITLS